MFRGRAKRLHFVGIGGIGMSGIAEVLVNLGFDVRGSDIALTVVTARLKMLGVCVHCGHRSENVGDADVVVTSSAVKGGNPEVCEAKRRGIPVITRAEMLAELMRMKYGIAVAGSHGKTTTTSLVATILHHGGIDPTMVIGGRLKSIGSNARLGTGQYLVAEADESDGSFLKLIPTIAVVTNINPEHLDHWRGGLPQLVDAFVDFVNKVPFFGVSVVCFDHPTVQAILPRIDKRVITYGFAPEADYVAEDVAVVDGGVEFSVQCRPALGSVLGDASGERIRLAMVGRHNVLNALAAIAVAQEVGVPFATTAKALRAFSGISRRFEIKGEVNGVLVADDYGHHPAEIYATLKAAREAYGRRLLVAFQPHRYTRTRDFLPAFAEVFGACDQLFVADVYAAGEKPIRGALSKHLAAAVQACGACGVSCVGGVENVAEALSREVRPGDLVLTLGAGNIWQAGEELLVYLRDPSMLEAWRLAYGT